MQQKEFKALGDAFQKSGLTNDFVITLKRTDRSDTGYLPAQLILEAVNEILKKKGSQPMNDRSLGKLTVALNTSSHGQYSYKEMLQHMYGAEKGAELFMRDLRTLESETQLEYQQQRDGGRGGSTGGFQLPHQIYNPVSNTMGNIGKKIIGTRTNYEIAIIKALGPNPRSTNLPKNDLPSILEAW